MAGGDSGKAVQRVCRRPARGTADSPADSPTGRLATASPYKAEVEYRKPVFAGLLAPRSVLGKHRGTSEQANLALAPSSLDVAIAGLGIISNDTITGGDSARPCRRPRRCGCSLDFHLIDYFNRGAAVLPASYRPPRRPRRSRPRQPVLIFIVYNILF
jgi:hypothetical protein